MKAGHGLAALLTVAIGVNVLQFSSTLGESRYRAFTRYDTADITKIAGTTINKFKLAFGLFFELGRRYPGSTIILPRSENPESEQASIGTAFYASMLSYGRAEYVAVATYDAAAGLSGLDYERFVVARGKLGQQRQPFVIAAGSNPEVFLVVPAQGKMILLDLNLLLKTRSTPRD